jgi:hypothetical protein
MQGWRGFAAGNDDPVNALATPERPGARRPAAGAGARPAARARMAGLRLGRREARR